MRIALIGPELEENLALRYIHAALAKAGHRPEVFGFQWPGQIPQLVSDITTFAPVIVGLSMVFTARSQEYVDLVGELRQAGYGGMIAAGGHFASFHAHQLLRDVPGLSGVLHGEGEQAMIDLAAAIDNPHAVLGATWRGPDGEPFDTPQRPPQDDLDALPWPSRFGPLHRYLGLPIANVLAGRGCFANCSFCSINAWHKKIGGKRFRQRSVDNLVAEMAQLYHERGIRIFNFHDDNFFLPRAEDNIRRYRAIRAGLDRLGVGRIGVQVKARPDTITPEVVEALVELGLFRVFLGIENNAVTGLTALGRAVDRDTNHRALELLLAADVHVTFNLLMFEPECTPADLRENIAFIRQYAHVPQNSCRVEAYEGTAIMDRLRAQGRLIGDYHGYTYRMTDGRSQATYEIFREVFSPRNFQFDGTNLLSMAVDYQLHVLRHFWPRQATSRLRMAARRTISDLNINTATLLTEAVDFAEMHPDAMAAEIAAFAQTLSHRRIAFDRGATRRMRAVIEKVEAAAAKPRSSMAGLKAAASVAAATLVLGTAGCDKDDHGTHPTEMAPPPTTPGHNAATNAANNAAGNVGNNAGHYIPPVVDPAPPELRPIDTYPCEMVPPDIKPTPTPAPKKAISDPAKSARPKFKHRNVEMNDDGSPATQPAKPNGPIEVVLQPHMSEMVAKEPPAPKSQPTSQPASQPTTTSGPASQPTTTSAPAELPELDRQQQAIIIGTLQGDTTLGRIAKDHGMAGKPVPIYIEINDRGVITKASVMTDPKEKKFADELEKKLMGRTMPVKAAGKATIEVRLRELRPHMFEMAPRPMSLPEK